MAAVAVGALDPAELDPANPAWVTAVDLVFDRLTGYDTTTNAAVPNLASSWSTSDLVHWTFTLDPGRTFSDGAPVTASDVVTSLERVAADPTSLPGARLDVIDGVAGLAAASTLHASGIVATDERTVSITTIGPYGDLPALLSAPGYGIIEASSLGAGQGPRGAGRYRISGVDGAITTLSADSMPEVQLVRYDSIATGANALRAGDVDWAVTPTGSGGGGEDARDTSFPNGAVITLGMNVRAPALTDLRVRQAIVRTIDRASVATATGSGVATAWSSLVPPVAHTDGCASPCAGDPIGARAALVAVGSPVSLHLDLSDEPVFRAVANEVVRQLTAVGIAVDQRVHSDADYAAMVESGQQELFLTGAAGLVPTPDPYLSAAYSSTGKANTSQLADSAVDAALAAARATADPAQRRVAYGAVEEAVFAQAAAVPLVALNTRCRTADGVSSIGSEPGRALVPSRLAFAR